MFKSSLLLFVLVFISTTYSELVLYIRQAQSSAFQIEVPDDGTVRDVVKKLHAEGWTVGSLSFGGQKLSNDMVLANVGLSNEAMIEHTPVELIQFIACGAYSESNAGTNAELLWDSTEIFCVAPRHHLSNEHFIEQITDCTRNGLRNGFETANNNDVDVNLIYDRKYQKVTRVELYSKCFPLMPRRYEGEFAFYEAIHSDDDRTHRFRHNRITNETIIDGKANNEWFQGLEIIADVPNDIDIHPGDYRQQLKIIQNIKQREWREREYTVV